MRQTKIVSYRTEQHTDFCDICGMNLDDQNINYEYGEAKCYYEGGTNYPEGKSTGGERIDLCANCMMNKVMPLIKDKFKIQSREIGTDW